MALLIGIITPPKGLGNVGKTEKLINKSDKVISDANKAGKLDEALSDVNKLDKEYFENQYGKNNVEQGFGDYKEIKDNINNNHAANQQANKSSNFDEHVVNEKGLGNAGKGTTNLQQLAKTEMDSLATLYNNKNVHPKDFTISVNGKTLVTDKSVSAGAPVFKGASEADVMAYFKQLSGVDAMPTAKIIPGKGTVYSVKVTEGPNAGSNITLRSFSDSATQTKAKWTIDIKNPGINKGNRVEMKFQ